jgi:hypothetical protein
MGLICYKSYGYVYKNTKFNTLISSYPRKRVSKKPKPDQIPAFAGMTAIILYIKTHNWGL